MLMSHKKSIYEVLGRSPIHPFPARMAPGIALEALGQNEGALRVLDPMAGSGTVLAVACSKGHEAIGIDIDPLAVLLTRVWTRPINANRIRSRAYETLLQAKKEFHPHHFCSCISKQRAMLKHASSSDTGLMTTRVVSWLSSLLLLVERRTNLTVMYYGVPSHA